MAQGKIEWGYRVFETAGAFRNWQASNDYRPKIQSVIPMDACEEGCGTGENSKVLVSYWVSPPGGVT